jgi:hypothetical protein
MATGQIGFDAREQFVVVQEPIQVGQDRLELEAKLGDLGKQILGVIAIT